MNHHRLSEWSRRASRSRQAFTLIELLTVIAIIGILAAILIPVASSVRESARRAVCQSNVRQQMLAMHMFAEDHFDTGARVPEHLQSMLSGATAGFWWVTTPSADNAPLSLYPDYIDDVEVFLCPSTQNRIRPNTNRAGVQIDLETNAANREDSRGGHSYEYFGWWSTHWPEGPMVKTPASVSGLESHIMLMFDGDDTPHSQNCPDPANNHGDAGYNVGFADGHVRWVPRGEVNDMWVASGHSRWCPEQ